MLLLQMMMVAIFKLTNNISDFKISLMLLLQMMIVIIFRLTNNISDFQEIIDVTLAKDDGRHIQARK